MKLLIIGSARHGKDSLAEIWRDEFGLRFKSSSEASAEIFIFDELKYKYGYQSFEECYEDRMNHRAEWFDLICDYNKHDKARLAKGILERADCYVGMRSSDEIAECKRQGLFDLVIWVDASKRIMDEDSSSFNITKSDADIVIENNDDLQSFTDRAIRLGNVLFKKS